MKLLRRTTALVCAAAAAMTTTGALAVDVEVNNTSISFDVEPQIINERTMVPMRAIFEVLGASIKWDGETQTVTAARGNDKISLTIGSDVMTVNGSSISLDSVPVIVGDRTMVPVRAISESLGSKVEWDDSTKTVKITDNSGSVNLSAANKYVPAWKTAYSDLLKVQSGKFELIYITNDNIPELIITEPVVVSRSGASIYTYANGSVKQVKWEDAVGISRIGGTIRYKERSGLFCTSGTNMGYGEENILSLSDDGNVSVEHKFEYGTEMKSTGSAFYYKWNGASVSQDTYDSEWSRLTEGYKEAGFNTSKTINSANIKSALGL